MKNSSAGQPFFDGNQATWQARQVAAYNLRGTAIKGVLGHDQVGQIYQKDPVDAAKPAVPFLKFPVLPALRGHADNVVNGGRVRIAKTHNAPTGLFGMEIGGRFADKRWGCPAIGVQMHASGDLPTIEKMNKRFVSHADLPHCFFQCRIK